MGPFLRSPGARWGQFGLRRLKQIERRRFGCPESCVDLGHVVGLERLHHTVRPAREREDCLEDATVDTGRATSERDASWAAPIEALPKASHRETQQTRETCIEELDLALI